MELGKLVPNINIHRLPTTKDDKSNCSELELIHAFVIKLKDPIKKDLVSRKFKYSSLQSLIEAVQRYEDHKAQDTKDITNWTPDVLYSGYGPTRPPNHGNQGQGTKSKRSGDFSGTSGQPAGTNRSRPSSSNFSGSNRPNNSNPYHKGQGKQSPGLKSGNDRFSNAGNSGQSEAPICFAFNQYERAFCELPNNQCNHKRLHTCQTCGRWGCKSRNHSQQSRPTGRPQAHVATCDHENFDGPISQTPGPADNPVVGTPSENVMQQMFNNYMQSMMTSSMEKVEGQPMAQFSCPDPQQPQALDQVLGKTFGMPAIAFDNHLSLSNCSLGRKTFCRLPSLQQGSPSPSP